MNSFGHKLNIYYVIWLILIIIYRTSKKIGIQLQKIALFFNKSNTRIKQFNSDKSFDVFPNSPCSCKRTTCSLSNEYLKNFRIPNHLAVIILQENISFNDIAKLVLWSEIIGIHFLTLCDDKGILKSSPEKLEESIAKERNKTCLENNKNLSVSSSDNIFKVTLLEPQDSKKHIIEAILEASKDFVTSKTETFEVHNMDFYIQKVSKLPEPELLIKFGGPNTLHGFLPWHIRLTEIIFMPTHHCLQLNHFLAVLHRFTCCEQRFGV